MKCPQCNGTGEVEVFDGAGLRRWRRDNDLALWQVAYAAQISLPYLSEIERCRKQPSEKVADRLQVVMKEMVQRD